MLKPTDGVQQTCNTCNLQTFSSRGKEWGLRSSRTVVFSIILMFLLFLPALSSRLTHYPHDPNLFSSLFPLRREALISCPDTKFLCPTEKQCISKDKLCDGNPDCKDGADEKDACCEFCVPSSATTTTTTTTTTIPNSTLRNISPCPFCFTYWHAIHAVTHSDHYLHPDSLPVPRKAFSQPWFRCLFPILILIHPSLPVFMHPVVYWLLLCLRRLLSSAFNERKN